MINIIYSKLESENIEDVSKVLKVLEENNLFVNYEITPNGISIDPDRIKDIWN
ncbi:hypothetical protein CONCODRAFT_13917 [Conidiobolus coronatus NRRL 28638]|uniref:Uncharacterized protein n=1 Tax=Conidiobolus coronatus (strain ATCC 28846 / CBS 209.66 / NRRL 28638) TaxID=796925 RepID=A0A137NPW2_CONC2|nr:hypothetical protein CONCODRAFT_13917 [Conidiobolus coronatus NRRL 28638]|eukprot:KXN64795.1 hypothetical protein CONCODRAFT_13917 [Conidiobolus coronatus NRRL 28638]